MTEMMSSSHILALTLFRTSVNFLPPAQFCFLRLYFRDFVCDLRVLLATNMQMKGNSDLDHDFKINLSRLHDYINANLIRSKITDLKTCLLFASSGWQHDERTHSTKWTVFLCDNFSTFTLRTFIPTGGFSDKGSLFIEFVLAEKMEDCSLLIKISSLKQHSTPLNRGCEYFLLH